MGKLGQGAFGTIYLVEDLEAEKQKSPKIIVLKTLKMDRNVGMDSGAIREVKILKEICHPNIITVPPSLFSLIFCRLLTFSWLPCLACPHLSWLLTLPWSGCHWNCLMM
jgi:serine/threonine protein kinase